MFGQNSKIKSKLLSQKDSQKVSSWSELSCESESLGFGELFAKLESESARAPN